MDISSLLNPVKGSNSLDHLQDPPNDDGRSTSGCYAHTSSPGLLAVEVGKPDSPSQQNHPIHQDRSRSGCIHQAKGLNMNGSQNMPSLAYDCNPSHRLPFSSLRSSLEVPALLGSPAQSLRYSSSHRREQQRRCCGLLRRPLHLLTLGTSSLGALTNREGGCSHHRNRRRRRRHFGWRLMVHRHLRTIHHTSIGVRTTVG